MRFRFLLVVAGCAALAWGGCNCNGDPGGDDAGPDGGGCLPNGSGCGSSAECCLGSCSARGICEPVNPGGDGGTDGGQCTALNGTCVSSVECCSGVCRADGTGTFRCSQGTTCVPSGGSCQLAGDCCSLSCAGGQCVSGSLCRQTGTGCDAGDPGACCTGVCGAGNLCAQPTGSTCKVAGDPCPGGNAGFDPSCCSKTCVDYDPTAAGADLRCGPGGSCRSEGEPCRGHPDCCSYNCGSNGVCQRPAVGGQCLVAGSACQSVSDCCSGICALDSRGFRTCQYLGGCRPEEELCRRDTDCCGDNSTQRMPPVCQIFSDAGVGRCKVLSGNAPAGEVCEGSRGNTCEPNNTYCTDDNSGIQRCAGVCDGGTVCGIGGNCLPNGSTCAGANDCCTRICAPRDGGFSCASACLNVGQGCSANADCCSGRCGLAGTCEAADAGVVCRPIGAACTANSECCELNCDTATGTCRTGTCPSNGQSCSTTNPCCAGWSCLNAQANTCMTAETCSCQIIIN